jgi:hypothetical protein
MKAQIEIDFIEGNGCILTDNLITEKFIKTTKKSIGILCEKLEEYFNTYKFKVNIKGVVIK